MVSTPGQMKAKSMLAGTGIMPLDAKSEPSMELCTTGLNGQMDNGAFFRCDLCNQADQQISLLRFDHFSLMLILPLIILR